MTVITGPLLIIDDDVSAGGLIEQWINGNKEHVIDALKGDHPGLTALVIVTGAASGRLKLADCNEIANRLIDARQEQFLASEKESDVDKPQGLHEVESDCHKTFRLLAGCFDVDGEAATWMRVISLCERLSEEAHRALALSMRHESLKNAKGE